MFNKKQQAPVSVQQYNYQNWDADFGFLTLVITRQVNMNKLFYIDTYIQQLDKFDTLHDQDMTNPHQEIVYNIYSALSKNYINFLVTKYFASEEKLIEFISDTVYMELIGNAAEANKEKIKSMYIKKRIKDIDEINKKAKL